MQKDVRVSSERESHIWEDQILYRGGVFRVSVLPQASHLALSSPIQLICLRTLPWGTHAHLGQDGSRSEGFWEKQDSLRLGIVLQLSTPRSLSAHV